MEARRARACATRRPGEILFVTTRKLKMSTGFAATGCVSASETVLYRSLYSSNRPQYFDNHQCRQNPSDVRHVSTVGSAQRTGLLAVSAALTVHNSAMCAW